MCVSGRARPCHNPFLAPEDLVDDQHIQPDGPGLAREIGDSDSRFDTDQAILARARALAPIFREHADAAEHDRRLAQPVIDALREAGMFGLFTLRSLGGVETDPVTLVHVAEGIASFDSAGV
jgi:alkylation response protein AidB-like acyl-CoA dehydrogenase